MFTDYREEHNIRWKIRGLPPLSSVDRSSEDEYEHEAL